MQGPARGARVAWWLLAIGVALLAASWRIDALDRRPLWLDEQFTQTAVRDAHTLAALWRTGSGDDFQHPPFAYLGQWLATHFGDTATLLRLPSVIAGLASIAAIGALGWLLAGRWAGLFAAGLASISIYHVDYSQQARPYMPGVAFTSGLYLALFAFLLRRSRAALVAFAACAIAALYTYHLALLHVAVAAGLALLHVARSRHGRADRNALAAAFAAIAVAYAPQLRNLAGFLSGQGNVPNHVLAVTPRFLDALVQRWGSGSGTTTHLYELAFAIGALCVAARRDLVSLGLLGWATAPMAVFALRPFSKYFDVRFLISSLPVFFLLAGIGVERSGRAVAAALARVAGGAWPRAVQIAAVAAVALAFLVPAARLEARYRSAEHACGDFVNDLSILRANGDLCFDHLVLNTIAAEQQWIVRNLRGGIALPPERLDAYTGTYQFEAGPPIAIRRSGDTLIARIENRHEFALVPQSTTRFVYRVVPARTITFELGPDGRAVALVLESKAGTGRATRVP